MLHHVDQTVGMTRGQVTTTVLPTAAEFLQMLSLTQGLCGTPQHGIEVLTVLPTVLQTYVHAHWHHGIFILDRRIAYYTDFGCQVMDVRVGERCPLKVGDEDVAFQEDVRQDHG